MGLTSFSMAPSAIPTARQVLAEADASQLRRVAAHVLRLSSVPDIERTLLTTLGGVSVGPVTSETRTL